jgi:molecular chaperone HtpG
MAQKKQYKAETRRLLDLMIHSIYTHKEIFLRELISNASDALDKIFHLSLHGDLEIDRTALKIHLSADQTARTLTITDNGIGMTADEMEDNLGVIAKSGSFNFKQALSKDETPNDDIDIIGQFGVGFYSAFMVADKVEVFSQSAKGGDSVRFESAGEDGYRIETVEKLPVGTRIVVHLKADDENEKYSTFLESYELRRLVKKYSDYIRYPITMMDEGKGIR